MQTQDSGHEPSPRCVWLRLLLALRFPSTSSGPLSVLKLPWPKHQWCELFSSQEFSGCTVEARSFLWKWKNSNPVLLLKSKRSAAVTSGFPQR